MVRSPCFLASSTQLLRPQVKGFHVPAYWNFLSHIIHSVSSILSLLLFILSPFYWAAVSLPLAATNYKPSATPLVRCRSSLRRRRGSAIQPVQVAFASNLISHFWLNASLKLLHYFTRLEVGKRGLRLWLARKPMPLNIPCIPRSALTFGTSHRQFITTGKPLVTTPLAPKSLKCYFYQSNASLLYSHCEQSPKGWGGSSKPILLKVIVKA